VFVLAACAASVSDEKAATPVTTLMLEVDRQLDRLESQEDSPYIELRELDKARPEQDDSYLFRAGSTHAGCLLARVELCVC
jgi:hypothetical protein